jgi:hypothetical protein
MHGLLAEVAVPFESPPALPQFRDMNAPLPRQNPRTNARMLGDNNRP